MSITEDKGKFIAFEGGEGAGKSTQARMLAEYLATQGIETVITREPGGTKGAEAIRELLLNPPGEGWNAKAEALLFAAARSDHVEHLIKPNTENGVWVICDRFVDSSRAYQGGAGGLGDDAIQMLHTFGSDGLRPDLTILIDVSEAQALERLAQRDKGQSDAIGGRDREYHRAVSNTFKDIAQNDPAGFAVIGGDASPEAVHQHIVAAVSQAFGT